MKKYTIIALVFVLLLFVGNRLFTRGWQDSWENLNGGKNSLVLLVVDDASMPVRDVLLRFYGNGYTPKYPFPFSPLVAKREIFEATTDKSGMTWVRWPRMTLGLHHVIVGGKELRIINMGDNCWDETWGGYATSSFAVLRLTKEGDMFIIRPERNYKGDKPFKI